jgi:hypothetical protein
LRPADDEGRGQKRLVERIRIAEGHRHRFARGDVSRHDDRGVVFTPRCFERREETPESSVVLVDGVIVESPRANPVVFLEESRQR